VWEGGKNAAKASRAREKKEKALHAQRKGARNGHVRGAREKINSKQNSAYRQQQKPGCVREKVTKRQGRTTSQLTTKRRSSGASGGGTQTPGPESSEGSYKEKTPREEPTDKRTEGVGLIFAKEKKERRVGRLLEKGGNAMKSKKSDRKKHLTHQNQTPSKAKSRNMNSTAEKKNFHLRRPNHQRGCGQRGNMKNPTRTQKGSKKKFSQKKRTSQRAKGIRDEPEHPEARKGAKKPQPVPGNRS